MERVLKHAGTWRLTTPCEHERPHLHTMTHDALSWKSIDSTKDRHVQLHQPVDPSKIETVEPPTWTTGMRATFLDRNLALSYFSPIEVLTTSIEDNIYELDGTSNLFQSDLLQYWSRRWNAPHVRRTPICDISKIHLQSSKVRFLLYVLPFHPLVFGMPSLLAGFVPYPIKRK